MDYIICRRQMSSVLCLDTHGTLYRINHLFQNGRLLLTCTVFTYSYRFGIRNPEKNLFRIPDPGVKKAPDPGSGSATLVISYFRTASFRRDRNTLHRKSQYLKN
jgi:hypothetical protein